MDIWIWATTSGSWEVVKKNKAWATYHGPNGKNVKKGMDIKIGDKIIFYISGHSRFGGIYEVKTDWHDPKICWPGENHPGSLVDKEIDLTEIQLGSANIKGLLLSLTFVSKKGKESWGRYVQGSDRGPGNHGKPIPEEDYNLILSELQKKSSIGVETELPELRFEEFKHKNSDLDSNSHSISSICGEIERGEYAVPNFQRYWVWTINQIEKLWDSIVRGYYMGSFLTWESDKLGRTPLVGAPKPEGGSRLILDGQQRITSIYYAIKALPEPIPKQKEAYEFFIDIGKLLNLSKHTKLLIVKGYPQNKLKGLDDTRTQYEKRFFPLSRFSDYHHWCDNFTPYLINEEKKDPARAATYIMQISRRLNSIWENYKIPIIKLPKDLKINSVADVFERINTTGTKLSKFDLLNARFARHDVKLHDLWDDTKREHVRIREWSDVTTDGDVALSVFKALIFSKSYSIKDDMLKLDEKYTQSDKFSREDFERDWIEISRYVDNAIWRVTDSSEYGAPGYKYIPHKTMIPVIAALLKEMDDKPGVDLKHKKMNFWYWNSILSGNYTKSSDTTAAKDFKVMQKWFEDRGAENPFSVPRQVDYKIKQNNALYNAVLSIIMKNNPTDFGTNDYLKFNTMEDHHIFPKSNAEHYGADDYIETILNRTLITRDTNKSIRNKHPSKYIQCIMDKEYISKTDMLERLEPHLISEDAFECLMGNKFGEFIEARKKTIKDKFNDLTTWEEV